MIDRSEHRGGHGPRWAGVAALTAAAAWLAWAIVNGATDGRLDGPRTGPGAGWGWLGTGLHVTWTVLVVPAALVLARELRGLGGHREPHRSTSQAAPQMAPHVTPHVAPQVIWLATAAGVVSLGLWTAAALGRWWPAGLEPTYIALSALWWLGVGGALRAVRRRLGTLTLVLGAAAVLDAVVTAAGDRLPFWAFPVLGGPKLPLQLAWTISLGVVLARHGQIVSGPAPALESGNVPGERSRASSCAA